MEQIVKGDLVYYQFQHLAQNKHIMHGFSSRLGGVSEGHYASMNLSFFSGDEAQRVKENYRLLLAGLNLSYDNAVRLSLVHGKEVAVIDDCDAGSGLSHDHSRIIADGAITNCPNIPLIATFADCVPLFFYDPHVQVIGIAHAGWRGTVKRIAAEMVTQMIRTYDADPQQILVGIGPSIGPCCFEVGPNVVEAFADAQLLAKDVYIIRSEKYVLDLWQINKNILLQAGISESHIENSALCTKCHKDIFFSHRGHHGKRGAMAGVIALKPL